MSDYYHPGMYTKKDLARAIKLAKQNKHAIDVIANLVDESYSVVIRNNPVGSGFGKIVMGIPTNHRTAKKISSIPGVEWMFANRGYTRFFFRVPNTPEAIEAAKKLGATISRDYNKDQNNDLIFTGVNKK
jgi:hypothetical protein